MPSTKPGRDFISLSDLSRDEFLALLERAAELKAKRRQVESAVLQGRTLALVFEKASTRTRVSFEVGIRELGGGSVHLSTQGSQLGRGEPIRDTARVLAGYCDGIVFRTAGHDRLVELAKFAQVPVINGLTDWLHPCQIVADLQTAQEEFGELADVVFAWIGDGNNMAHSWLHAAGVLGLSLKLACPTGYKPDPQVVEFARQAGAKVEIFDAPLDAVQGADVVSTDVWASMGQEEEAAARRDAFAGYCVDAELLANANERGIVLHCLPAHRGEEISDAALEGARSRVFRQAENRLHAQKAILEYCLA